MFIREMNVLYLDKFLQRLPPMYPLMFYYLLLLFGSATLLSILKLLPYNPLDLILTALYLNLICYISNQFLAKLFKSRAKTYSQHITAFILTLIIGPLSLLNNIVFVTFVAVLAMASKYLLVWQKKHIFNPAGFGVLASALFIKQGASWWAGSSFIAPLIIAGGLLVVYKMRRFHLVLSFLATYLAFVLLMNLLKGSSMSELTSQLSAIVSSSSFLFFIFVMLIEPLTSPTNRNSRIFYGIFIAFMLVVYENFLGVSYTLELALLTGNLFGHFFPLITQPNSPQVKQPTQKSML